MVVVIHKTTSFIMNSNEEVVMADLINILNHFVQEQPEAVAVRHTNDELTYKQLDEESSKLAHLLQDSKSQ